MKKHLIGGSGFIAYLRLKLVPLRLRGYNSLLVNDLKNT